MRRIFAQVILALLALAPGLASAGELRVYFFDVGQGDAALIVSPSGKTVLIDAGPPEAAPHLRARLEQLLSAPLDLVVLTHAHLDHLGGMESALSVRGAQLFMDSGFDHPSPGYEALLKTLDARQIRMVNALASRTIDLGGGASLQILSPPQPFLTGTPSDANANSVVLKLRFGKHAVLFAADAEAATESELLKQGVDLHADVLKVAHHGARTSSSAAFLAAVRPSFAVISSGPGNGFEAPSRSVIDRLEAVKAHVLRTDLDGEVRLTSDGKSITVRGESAQTPALALTELPDPPAAIQLPPPTEHHPAHGGHPGASHGHPEHATHAATPADHLATPTRVVDAPPQTHEILVVPVNAHASAKHYLASQNSDVFHNADCSRARRIKPENLITFPTRDEAVNSGRRPASCCNP